MARLDEISAKFTAADAPEVDMENMPEESSGFRPTPFPGDYGFQLPAEMDYEDREVKAKDKEGNIINDPTTNTPKMLKRLVTLFGDGHELKILDAAPENQDFVGDTLKYRCGNAEYRYGKDKILASEMGFLLRALNETLAKGATNIQWAQAIAKHSLGKFRATIEWDAHCNPERKRFVFDEAQSKNVEDSMMGCGRRYGQRAYVKGDGTKVIQIPQGPEAQPDGSIIDRFKSDILCECGATVRCFPRLKKYRPYEG